MIETITGEGMTAMATAASATITAGATIAITAAATPSA